MSGPAVRSREPRSGRPSRARRTHRSREGTGSCSLLARGVSLRRLRNWELEGTRVVVTKAEYGRPRQLESLVAVPAPQVRNWHHPASGAFAPVQRRRRGRNLRFCTLAEGAPLDNSAYSVLALVILSHAYAWGPDPHGYRLPVLHRPPSGPGHTVLACGPDPQKPGMFRG